MYRRMLVVLKQSTVLVTCKRSSEMQDSTATFVASIMSLCCHTDTELAACLR